jgi:hypothetical protein
LGLSKTPISRFRKESFQIESMDENNGDSIQEVIINNKKYSFGWGKGELIL